MSILQEVVYGMFLQANKVRFFIFCDVQPSFYTTRG